MRSKTMFPLTPDRNENWRWPQFVSFETYRLICKMTYLGHHMTSRDLDLMLDFDLFFFFKAACMYAYASRRDKYDGVWIISLIFFVQKLFARNIFRENLLFWLFMTCGLLPKLAQRNTMNIEICKKKDSSILFYRFAPKMSQKFPQFPDISQKRHSLTFPDLWWPQY